MDRDGWHELTVDDIKADSPSALAAGPFGSSIGSRFFTDHGVPVIRGSNLSQNVGIRLIDDGLVYVSPEKAEEFQRCIVRSGDLVFTCWGTIDQVGLIDDRCRYGEYIVSNKQMKLSPNPAKVDSLFLYYLFSGPEMRSTLLSHGIGSSVPGLNLGILRSLRLRLPPIDVQRAIARMLGVLDDKIELNRRMNATLEELARALFKSWFVDFDPVTSKAAGRPPTHMAPATAALFPDRFVDSDLGPIPKGWTVGSIPEAFDVNPNRQIGRGVVAPYLDMQRMPVSSAIPDSWIERECGSGMRFTNGDTLLARITPCLENGKTAYVNFLSDGEVGWGSTEYIVLRSKNLLPLEFSYFVARDDDFRAFAIANMTGSSGRQRVPAECLGQYQLVIPSKEAAAAFGKIAKATMDQLLENSAQSRALAATRDALLPQLLSGAIRLSQAEKLFEEAV